MNIKIAVADDHPMIIKGLQNMLSSYQHISLISTYATGELLLAGLQHEQPDVLLLDIQLPGKTGDELAPIILKKYPDMKILTLTNFDSMLYVNTMMRHGVHGYLLKNTDEEVLIKAIETVYNGGEFLEPAMKEKMQHLTLKMQKENYSKIALTLREKQILQLIVNGKTSHEIVEKLFLSINTVNNYRARIFIKLDVNNMAELIKKALTLGLVD
jgi:DNA-binding NarL/FixJ family response regulator